MTPKEGGPGGWGAPGFGGPAAGGWGGYGDPYGYGGYGGNGFLASSRNLVSAQVLNRSRYETFMICLTFYFSLLILWSGFYVKGMSAKRTSDTSETIRSKFLGLPCPDLNYMF